MMKVKEIIKMIQTRGKRKSIYSKSEYWDLKAQDYKETSISMWRNYNLNFFYEKEQFSMIDKFLPDVHNKEILDIGCGYGRTSEFLANKGGNVTGIDFSQETIKIANQKKSQKNINYLVKSIFDINEVNQYDIIISWGVLAIACSDKHELEIVMSKLSLSLKEGGIMLLMEPVHDNMLYRVLQMNIKNFSKVITNSGFKIISTSALYFWPMRLLLAYCIFPKVITKIGYNIGYFILKITKYKYFGDYSAFLCEKKKNQLSI